MNDLPRTPRLGEAFVSASDLWRRVGLRLAIFFAACEVATGLTFEVAGRWVAQSVFRDLDFTADSLRRAPLEIFGQWLALLPAAFAAMLGAALAACLYYAVAYGAAAAFLRRLHEQGDVSLGAAWRAGLMSIGATSKQLAVFSLPIFGVVLTMAAALAILSAFAHALGMGLTLLLGFFAVLVAGAASAWSAVFFVFVIPALVFDAARGLASLKTAWATLRPRAPALWLIAAAWGVSIFAASIVVMIFGVLLPAASSSVTFDRINALLSSHKPLTPEALGLSGFGPVWLMVVNNLLSGIAGALVTSYFVCLLVVWYGGLVAESSRHPGTPVA